MIDDAENIDEPEEYQQAKNANISYTEILPAEESSDNLTSEKNTFPAPDSSKPVSKKVPPPIPFKPDHLKVSAKPSDTENELRSQFHLLVKIKTM